MSEFVTTSKSRTVTAHGIFNTNRKPIGKKEDGTNIYPMEINSSMFIDLDKIECVEEVKDFEDWFQFPSERVINIYMIPEIMNGCRNVITVGFMS